MPHTTVAHHILARLAAEGVTHCFTVPGGPILPLLDALADDAAITPVLAKHEEGAAFMALGHAQAGRAPALVAVTTGPGATNALTGVASADADQFPLLLITGQVATGALGRGSLQDSSGGNWSLDTVDVFRTATRLSTVAGPAPAFPGQLEHALRTAYGPRPGAVHLSIPADVLTGPHPHEPTPPAALNRPPRRPPDPRAITELAAALRNARHPVALAGRGAKLSGATSALVRLAHRYAMPVATTLQGKGAYPEDDPYALGVFGFGGKPTTRDIVCDAHTDLILIIGSSLGELATFGWDQTLVHSRVSCQIDTDPLRIGRNFPIDLPVIADARAALEQLLPEDADNADPAARPPAGLVQPRTGPSAAALQDGHPLLQASAVTARISELVPPDTALYIDNGNSLSWAGQFYTARAPGRIHTSLNVGSMGYALAAVIGGKLADPTRPALALLGDAAFAMHGMEIHTAAELDLAAVWVVLNNGGHAMVGNVQHMLYQRSPTSRYTAPLDVARLARAMGAQADVVTDLAEFDDALKSAGNTRHPYVIDARVDFDEVPWALSTRAHTLEGFFHPRSAPDAHG
jgi:acetolactate synthase I/II/III large subunit